MTVAEMEHQLDHLVVSIPANQIKRVYLTGCGGGIANLRPCEYVLNQYLEEGQVASTFCANLMVEKQRRVDEHALVIVGSFNGTMKEAVDAMRWAKARGAYVIGVTYVPGTPIATESDFPFLCDTLEAPEPALSPMSAGVLLAHAIIKAMTGRDQLIQAWQALLSLRGICEQAVRLYEETKGHEFVARFRKSPMIYTVGGGLNYTNAYILATCYLTEMQWIHACPVEASEFFHGVLEIADKDSCFIALLGLGESRPLEERVVKFLDRFTRGTCIIDAADYDMEAVDPQMQNVIATIVTARVIRSLIHRLADARRHPMTTRRYYLKYEY